MPTDECALPDSPHRTDRAGLWWFEGTTARRLAAAFVLYGLVATVFLGINVPPFQTPDEFAHFMRAAQIADGGLIAQRNSMANADGSRYVSAGGWTDLGLPSAFHPFATLAFHRDVKATRAMWAPRYRWLGTPVMWGFPNTAINPPLFYLPATIGVLLGRASRMTVLQTLVASRLLNGVTAVAIGAMAIACAGGAAVWLFAILTLPMSLSLIASSSHDALMLACSAMAGAFLVRLLRRPNGGGAKAMAGLTTMLALVAASRVPYAMLALLPLGVTGVRLRWRVAAAAAIPSVVLLWSGVLAAPAMINVGALVGADPSAQMAWLLAHPLRVVPIAWTTITLYWPHYLDAFIGRLGWLDTVLPRAYYPVAWAMLGVAMLAAMLGLTGRRISVGSGVAIAAGLLLAAGGIFAAEYVIWTVPGKAQVEGVEGRYFLPLALAGVALLPALGGTRLARLHNPLVLAVALFPVVSLAAVMQAVVQRYYLG